MGAAAAVSDLARGLANVRDGGEREGESVCAHIYCGVELVEHADQNKKTQDQKNTLPTREPPWSVSGEGHKGGGGGRAGL